MPSNNLKIHVHEHETRVWRLVARSMSHGRRTNICRSIIKFKVSCQWPGYKRFHTQEFDLLICLSSIHFKFHARAFQYIHYRRLYVCVCVYVYLYICICVCMCVCVRKKEIDSMHAYVCVFLFVRVWVSYFYLTWYIFRDKHTTSPVGHWLEMVLIS